MEEIEKQKFQAEIDKLQLESQEIERRLQSHVGARRFLIEGIVGGLVAAGLLAAWLIVYLQPIISAKSELSEITAKTHEANVKKLSEEKSNLEKAKERLEKSKIEAEKQAEKLIAVNAQLQNQQEQSKANLAQQKLELEKLAAEINELSSALNINELEKKKLTALTAKAQNEIARLSEEKEKLSEDITNTIRRGDDLDVQRIRTILSPYTYWILHESEELQDVTKIENTLSKFSLIPITKSDNFQKRQRTVKTEANVSESAISELKKLFPDYSFIKSSYTDGEVTIYP
ncbi:hypothetical protein [Pseudoalteromonas sp. OOF1S-7]|uniref:hypothetical protein n=1 Tax=Pseudoalteromonas sp. OOF1S-7 TaxID=2917757 RepID=UPI001EF5A9AE|nr:hypothetical protein [Pseudoalteromonas sp. OOF1S-7]MCG7533531.1 hypothetical protein [Pseudoalteromonas sp. OOF1S-7]